MSSARPEAFCGPSVIPPEEIVLKKEIGGGAYGVVYLGLCRGQEVAVKKPRKRRLNRAELKQFKKEVEFMNSLFNPHICLFMGASINEVEGKVQIVTELMKGDLESLVRPKDGKRPPIPLSQRMQFARDAATGMAWLHGGREPLVHRDLKLGNLLYDENMRVKVCDFGLSHFQISPEMVESDPRGTPLYMAPEVLCKGPITPAVDVYSFGIILWELSTRREAFENHNNYKVFVNAVSQGERPQVPLNVPKSLQSLMAECWVHVPEDRPSFEVVVSKLEKVISDCKELERREYILGACKCPAAAEFWMEHFFWEDSVPVKLYIEKLYGYLELDLPVDPSLTLLPDIPTEEQLRRASQFQLEEFAKRNPENLPIVKREEERRNEEYSGNAGRLNRLGYTTSAREINESLRDCICVEEIFSVDDAVEFLKFAQITNVFQPFNKKLPETLADIMSNDWFHGFVKRGDLNNMLGRRKRRTYLVRFSNTDDALAISVVDKKREIRSILATCSDRGWSIEKGTEYFPSFLDLMAEKSHSLGLREPCPGSKFEYLFDGDSEDSDDDDDE